MSTDCADVYRSGITMSHLVSRSLRGLHVKMEHGCAMARRPVDCDAYLCASQQSYMAPESLSTHLTLSVFRCLSLPFYDSGGKAVLESSLPFDSEHSRLPPGGGGEGARPAESHRTTSPDQCNVGVAPLFLACEDLQSSIGDTVVFPEPRLLLLHATYEWCEVRCRFTGRCVLTAFAPAICEDFAKPLENRVYGHVTCLPLY